jgi:RNA polymerase sigma factor (sigma-70 family)
MLYNQSMGIGDGDDPALVTASLKGDREAFAQIVTRYQALIASVAYSGTGNLAQSEDIAQETFVTAWKQLNALREPGKLRSWLCGIARLLTANARRHEQRDPVQGAAPLEHVIEAPALEALPVEHAMTHEEEAILWRSLEQIPETYRVPLILFYRENQSIERVAESLELSSEAVRQRLSRGRKLLEERVTAFVEGALRQSAPGRSFTMAVLGALPAQMTAVGSASATVAAAKGGVVTKGAAWLAVLSSFAGLFAGSLAGYIGYRTDIADARSELERKHVRRIYGLLAGCVLFSTSLIFVALWAKPLALTHPGLYTALAVFVGLSWVPAALLLAFWITRTVAAREQSRSAIELEGAGKARPALEYRSRLSLLGLPLVHIRIGGTWATRRRPVKAWIAVGDIAFGGLFAMGGIALAPVAFGGFAVGGVLFGGFGLGILAYAGFGLGIWAMGGIVIGLQAIGGCAIGWTAAAGGVAIAHEVAQGGVALALHANDAVAQAAVARNTFFQYAYPLMTTWLWPTMILAVLPSIVISQVARKRRRQ